MTTKPLVAVSPTAVNLNSAASLTDGERYIAQNVGSHAVEWTVAVDPTAAPVPGWHALPAGEWVEIPSASAASPIWVRSPRGRTALAISDA